MRGHSVGLRQSPRRRHECRGFKKRRTRREADLDAGRGRRCERAATFGWLNFPNLSMRPRQNSRQNRVVGRHQPKEQALGSLGNAIPITHLPDHLKAPTGGIREKGGKERGCKGDRRSANPAVWPTSLNPPRYSSINPGKIRAIFSELLFKNSWGGNDGNSLNSDVVDTSTLHLPDILV